MSVRLNKVCRDLNIGFQTIREFLSSKGFEIELNPNFKLTDEQASLVYRHFSDKEYIPRPKPILPINNGLSSDIITTSPLEDFDWDQYEVSLTEESSENSSYSSFFQKHDIVSARVIARCRMFICPRKRYLYCVNHCVSMGRFLNDIFGGQTGDKISHTKRKKNNKTISEKPH